MADFARSNMVYCREFEIILHSATDLPDVRDIGRMKVYAKVSISQVPESETETQVDKERETSPRWNCKIKYAIAEELINQDSTDLVIKLYCKRFLGDRYVGEVNINLKSLFGKNSGENLRYDVLRKYSEGTFGKLNLSYKFGEKVIFEESISDKPSRLQSIIAGGVLILVEAGLGVALESAIGG